MRSGIVPVVGRPNVGKSTLINALVGTKVSITSPRPQTTRNVIRGVVHRPELQIVLVDTPGVHRPRTALGERLNERVTTSLQDADAVVFVVDATAPIGPGDRLIASRLLEAGTPTVCVVNKSDAADNPAITAQLGRRGCGTSRRMFRSAPSKARISVRWSRRWPRCFPKAPPTFPDMSSDQTESFLVGEIVREKFLARLRDELPHSLAVMVEEMDTGDDGVTRIHARLLVERDSQKGIVIGAGGATIKEAGTEARMELETLLGTKVFLDLKVKVEKDWQRRPGVIERLGM